jgi:hypothetical protein
MQNLVGAAGVTTERPVPTKGLHFIAEAVVASALRDFQVALRTQRGYVNFFPADEDALGRLKGNPVTEFWIPEIHGNACDKRLAQGWFPDWRMLEDVSPHKHGSEHYRNSDGDRRFRSKEDAE